MKNSILNSAFTILVVSSMLIGCKDSTNKEEQARENVEEARVELNEAKTELSNARKAATEQEWKEFKESTNNTIRKNEDRIAELKSQMKRTNTSMDNIYEKRIEELEEKNRLIKNKLNAYKNEVSDDWQNFKNEYNKDMDDLGESLKNFTVKNN
ncbi:chromosome segregation ATPase [Flavobacterium sp. PL11]|uniref:hypothetical protein n=1 Tax=Flavobacterium sp. PL11 TaxID=3071717 RepID=UPI002E06638C|nr:chromosome segregation ATPase [Flavobacterium sp. PL11]